MEARSTNFGKMILSSAAERWYYIFNYNRQTGVTVWNCTKNKKQQRLGEYTKKKLTQVGHYNLLGEKNNFIDLKFI
jgi:outer membrane protein assembly factor BamE (lipoprotein component of BamABCDE complex)